MTRPVHLLLGIYGQVDRAGGQHFSRDPAALAARVRHIDGD